MTDEQRDKLRRAIALPGYTLSDGMLLYRGRASKWRCFSAGDGPAKYTPDPDDPATAGCLLALLGAIEAGADPCGSGRWSVSPDGERYCSGPSLGWACIEAALALGRWPGGEG